jgi:hypothetical protein
MLCSSILSSTE